MLQAKSYVKSSITFPGVLLEYTILCENKYIFRWGVASVNMFALRDISSFLAPGMAGQGLRSLTLCGDRACQVLKRVVK